MKLEITNLKGAKEMINVPTDIYDKINGIKMETNAPRSITGLEYYPPRPIPIPNTTSGWECPKCHMVYSPMIKMCGYCSHSKNKVPSDGTPLQLLNEGK